MNKAIIFVLIVSATSLLTSCDSGDIYPVEDPSAITRTLHIQGEFTGHNTVPSDRDRKLMVFTYPKGSSESNRSVRVNAIEEGETSVDITLVPSDATHFIMAITDQGNSIMYEICSGSFEAGTNDAAVSVGNVNMLSYKRLQAQLYDQSCISCHGTANPSSGLVLEQSVSWQNTVNHATSDGEGTIIIPLDEANSVMLQKLISPDDFHSRFSTLKTNDTDLLREWIMNGAKNN